MPFKSRAQQRAAFAGAIPGFSKKRAKKWAKETDFEHLPEHVEKKAELELFEEMVKLCSLIRTPSAVAPSLRRTGLPKPTSTMVNQTMQNAAGARANGRFSGMMGTTSLKSPSIAEPNLGVNPNMGLREARRPRTAIPRGS
jgi:hypothetical protein